MTKWMLRIASLATLTVVGVLAQDLTGTWQGKLLAPQAPNGELRIVFKILKADVQHDADLCRICTMYLCASLIVH
jgi:hypothetical protein